jgi:hypothetical protein
MPARYNPWTSGHLDRIGTTRDTEYGILLVRESINTEDAAAATAWLEENRYHWMTVHASSGKTLTGWVWIGPAWKEKSVLTDDEVITDHSGGTP